MVKVVTLSKENCKNQLVQPKVFSQRTHPTHDRLGLSYKWFPSITFMTFAILYQQNVWRIAWVKICMQFLLPWFSQLGLSLSLSCRSISTFSHHVRIYFSYVHFFRKIANSNTAAGETDVYTINRSEVWIQFRTLAFSHFFDTLSEQLQFKPIQFDQTLCTNIAWLI